MAWRTRIFLALGVLTGMGVIAGAVSVAYEVGGRIGYLDGYAAASLDHEMTNASLTTSALESIRKGDLEAGTLLLEASVDSAVLVYSYIDRCGSRFEPSERKGLPTDRVFRRIAKYRRAHPSTAPYASLRKTITRTVERAPELDGSCEAPGQKAPSPAPVQTAGGQDSSERRE